jgi:hypothetical protein
VAVHDEMHVQGQVNRTESEIKLVTGLHYLLLEFTSKTICATAPPFKAGPVEGIFVPVNGIEPYRGVKVQVHSFSYLH